MQDMTVLKRNCIKEAIDIGIFLPLVVLTTWYFVSLMLEKDYIGAVMPGVMLCVLGMSTISSARMLIRYLHEALWKKDIRCQVMELNRNNYAVVNEERKLLWKVETRVIIREKGEERIMTGTYNMISGLKSRKVKVYYLWKSGLLLSIQPAEEAE